MNTPPLFIICAADPVVTSIFQESPADSVRVYPFSHTEKHGFNLTLPYCVWQTTGGSPENYLGCEPDQDNVLLQIDVYGADPETVRNGSNAIEAAIQSYCYITKYMTENFEKETKLYRTSFGVDWIVKR